MSMTVQVPRETCCSNKETKHEERTHFSSASDFMALLVPVALAVGVSLALDESSSVYVRVGVFALLVAALGAGLAVLAGIGRMEAFENKIGATPRR